MSASSRIAWSEFRVGFSRRSTGAPGARDFVSLAVFFGLMMFLILLGWSVREGLWGRIEQVLLGALPEGQPPVRLSYHIDATSKISTNILAGFATKFPDLQIVPQRSASGGSGAIVLPGVAVSADDIASASSTRGTWAQGLSDKRETPLRIDAVPLDAPLWKWILQSGHADPAASQTSVAPLLVAASRHLFREHFRYDLYRKELLANRMVPCDLKSLLPDRLDDIAKLDHLVLEVKENIVSDQGRRSTTPSYQSFRIVWVDSFPTPDRTAIVIPLSTYEILWASAERQTVVLNAEQLDGRGEGRLSQIRLAEVDQETDGIPEFMKLASCLGAVPADSVLEGDENALKGADICKVEAGGAASMEARRWRSRDQNLSCEKLREKLPVKYPRIVNNGLDLYICSGEHRRLRGHEVDACAKAAGLKPLSGGAKQFDNRLEPFAVRTPPPIEWLGPSRVAVACGMLSGKDLETAKAVQLERVRATVSRNPASAPASVSAGTAGSPGVAAWVSECEAYKAAHPDDSFGGPKAEIPLPGYEDVTVYTTRGGADGTAVRGIGERIASTGSEGRLWFSRTVNSATSGATSPAGAPGQAASGGENSALNTLTKSLLSWETTLGRPEGGVSAPVFRLDPNYESALVRFGVLSLILDKVSTPFAAGSLALFVFLTAVILMTATSHRRRQYGLLLMSGLQPGGVGYIVALQIVLSSIVGGIGGYLLSLVTSFGVNALLAGSTIVSDARMIIGLDVPTFLPPIDWATFAGLWTGMALIAVAVGTVVLRLQGITNAKSPIELVKS